MFLSSFLISAIILGVKGQCSFEEKPKVNGLCSVEIFCEGTQNNVMDILKNWNCIRHRKQNRGYYYNNNHDYEYDTNYYLNVYVSKIFSDYNFSQTINNMLHTIASKIQTIDIKNSTIRTVDSAFTSTFSQLAKFSLTYSDLESIHLPQFSGVKTLNVSHNEISTIESGEFLISSQSLTTSIDLSYNGLKSIPNNCFAMFPNLRYLDLSFNNLMHFDILTFEGITQLETLQLSHNKISELGQNFARFMKLKYLSLDNNQLTSITDLNFRTLVSLEKLNLSSNLIKQIEEQSLAALTKLEELDLSYNEINVVFQKLFKNNKNLYKLSLSHNVIEKIEGGAFETTNLTQFDIDNNIISGSIEYNTFLGISVESLDLSKGNLKTLGHKAFSSLGSSLRYLNLSANLIENITSSAFQSLKVLSKLDLSRNNLIDIDFNTSDLKQMTEYYLHKNNIKKLTPKLFNNMEKLLKLDLSQNEIEDYELDSFIKLINLKDLNISHNFINSLKSHVFQGLYKVQNLDLSETTLVSCLNESFSGLVSLNYLNLSHNQLEIIEYETFKSTGAIKIIDMSHNKLEYFHINTSSILLLSELYLNHNKLKNVTNETFRNLSLLEKLNLAFNDILSIDSSGLQTLSKLRYLDLYSNFNLHIKGDIFNNMVLLQVTLSHVRQPFNFGNSVNTSIATLLLSKCEIMDINSVFVYKFRSVIKLDISSNKIYALDKGSFENMDALNWLDLSFNRISNIQPGTFLTNNMINTLNLYGNNLKFLRFGVLDGLRNLRILNLSNNEIHTFGINLLHSSPHLTKLFLENNNLAIMDFGGFSETSVKLLTIGGNRISCDAFAEWNKLNNHTLNVTAERFDFNSENVHGISCIGKTRTPVGFVTGNVESYNISSEVNEIKDTLKKLYGYLKISFNETFPKIISFIKSYPEYRDKVSAEFNHSQTDVNKKLGNLIKENQNLLTQLVNSSNNVSNDLKQLISLLKINNNLTKLGNDKVTLQTPFSEKIYRIQENQNSAVFQPKSHSNRQIEEKLESVLSDIHILLYFITIFLAIVILGCVGTLIYKYYYRQASHKKRVNDLYDSEQSVRDGIEME